MSVCKCCYRDQWWKIEYCFLFALLRDPVVVCLCTTPVPCRAETFSVGHGSFGFREYFIARYLFLLLVQASKFNSTPFCAALVGFWLVFQLSDVRRFFASCFWSTSAVCVCLSVFVFFVCAGVQH